MNRTTLLIGGAAAIVLLAGVGFLVLGRHGSGDEGGDIAPIANVTLAQVRHMPLQDVIDVYGVVAPDPASEATLAAPRPLIVSRILVRTGEMVRAGQGLVEVVNSPGSDQAYRQAVAAAEQARSDLARVQRLYDERLAANDQLQAARKALSDAQAALAAQQRQGAGHKRQILTASAAGVVTNVTVSVGDHVSQDAPVVNLATSAGLVAKLGLEPGALVRIGDPVALAPVSGTPSKDLVTRISTISLAADPATRTFDALAPLSGRTWALGSAVEARVTTGAHDGLAVPRGAVVFDETGTHVFTVSGGHAHRVFVTAGRTYGQNIEVSGPIHAGDAVAVQGADELEDGMAVKVAGR